MIGFGLFCAIIGLLSDVILIFAWGAAGSLRLSGRFFGKKRLSR